MTGDLEETTLFRSTSEGDRDRRRDRHKYPIRSQTARMLRNVHQRNVSPAPGIEYRLRMVKPIGREHFRREDRTSCHSNLHSGKKPIVAAVTSPVSLIFR